MGKLRLNEGEIALTLGKNDLPVAQYNAAGQAECVEAVERRNGLGHEAPKQGCVRSPRLGLWQERGIGAEVLR